MPSEENSFVGIFPKLPVISDNGLVIEPKEENMGCDILIKNVRNYNIQTDWIYTLAGSSAQEEKVIEIRGGDIKIYEDGMTPITKFGPDGIKKVIYNPPATVVMWADGTKTVVKCSEDDAYDKLTGFLLCVMKKFCGGSRFNDIIRKWVWETDENKNVQDNTYFNRISRMCKEYIENVISSTIWDSVSNSFVKAEKKTKE